jgi:soluble lytic murein transglycosylase-like protein
VRRWTGSFILLFLLIFPIVLRADVFGFKDDRGVWHFSDQKVDGRYRVYMHDHARPTQSGSFYMPPRVLRDVEPAAVGAMIDRLSAKYGIDAALVRAVVKVESNFDTNAVSSKGARGLMQLMPETARNYGVQDAHDPEQNLDGGIRHLCELMIQFNGELPLTLAAYNAGKNSLVQHGGVPPYQETQRYIQAVIAAYRSYSGRR